MTTFNHISARIIAVAILSVIAFRGMAQNEDSTIVYYPDGTTAHAREGRPAPMADTISFSAADSLRFGQMVEATAADTIAKKQKRDWAHWRPNAKRAMWLAIVLPGAGQIYNRKYWKLPIFYGGFVGCIYALSFNNQMYHDYSQAYLDIMDNDPTTQSYNDFLHLGNTVTEANKQHYQDLFKKRKDRYRRWRDLSVFAMVGVYALSVIDAYVDASLSEFDISDDLSLRVAPTVMSTQEQGRRLESTAVGIGCQLNF